MIHNMTRNLSNSDGMYLGHNYNCRSNESGCTSCCARYRDSRSQIPQIDRSSDHYHDRSDIAELLSWKRGEQMIFCRARRGDEDHTGSRNHDSDHDRDQCTVQNCADMFGRGVCGMVADIHENIYYCSPRTK